MLIIAQEPSQAMKTEKITRLLGIQSHVLHEFETDIDGRQFIIF